MQIEEIFTSFLVFDNLDLDNTSIKDYCLRHITKGDNTNTGSLDLSADELQPLLSKVINRVNAVHAHIGLSTKWEQYIWRYWANLNCTKDIVAPHCHPESFFSCVYFVTGEGEESGRLEFLTPVNQMLPVVNHKMIDTYNKYLSPTWWVDPEPGKLVIFPSWLWHFVNKNNSNEDRISIAIDTKVRERK